jgi:hypothetical protein
MSANDPKQPSLSPSWQTLLFHQGPSCDVATTETPQGQTWGVLLTSETATSSKVKRHVQHKNGILAKPRYGNFQCARECLGKRLFKPSELVASTPIGDLKNPNPARRKNGTDFDMSFDCSSCHGGSGGGGIASPFFDVCCHAGVRKKGIMRPGQSRLEQRPWLGPFERERSAL